MKMKHRTCTLPSAIAGAVWLVPAAVSAQPAGTTDLATVPPTGGGVQRIFGSSGNGSAGVPVAGGFDADGDGFDDYAFAAMRASPLGRNNAGEIFLVFGTGVIDGEIDTAGSNPRVLRIIGDQVQENAGSELWMDDVTGDGLGDLLICRQNFSPDGGTRIGAGALTVIPGSALLRTLAANLTTIDLRAPPPALNLTTLHGAVTGDRLGIWARTGDVTGDGIADLVIGADRQTQNGESDGGAAYLIRGGTHLASGQTVDLAAFGAGALPGNIARMRPPPGSANFHFGATVQIADLDGNGRSEVLAAAALNRAGAALPPLGGSGEGIGGSPDGTVYIAWDDHFTGDWLPVLDFVIGAGPGSHTIIDGGADNVSFGEELLAGLDYDNDGNPDLFAGDLVAGGFGGISRPFAGLGHVFYNAAMLKNQVFDLDAPPPGLITATFLGPAGSAIAGDTALHGDFNGDGIADLAIASPHDTHFGRINSGTIHILLGQNGVWPAFVDLAPANFPTPAQIVIHEIYGANGNTAGNQGDTLAYSAAAGDLDGDGITDLITNEMTGDGLAPGSIDVGNLILINGAAVVHLLFRDGFEAQAAFSEPSPQRQASRL